MLQLAYCLTRYEATRQKTGNKTVSYFNKTSHCTLSIYFSICLFSFVPFLIILLSRESDVELNFGRILTCLEVVDFQVFRFIL